MKNKKIELTEIKNKYRLIIWACSSIHVFKKWVEQENEFY